MLELEVKIEAGDLYDYMLRHTYHSASGVVGSVIGVLLVVLAAWTKQWLYLVLGAVILLYLPWTLFMKSRQQMLMNPGFKKPLHYALGEGGLTISQGEDSVQYGWGDMYKAVATKRSIILYTSLINATIFPRRQIKEKEAAVLEMIFSNMPSAKMKIRA